MTATEVGQYMPSRFMAEYITVDNYRRVEFAQHAAINSRQSQDWPDISRHHQSVRQQWLRSNGGLQWNQPLEVKPSRISKVVQPFTRGKLLVRTHYHNDMDGL